VRLSNIHAIRRLPRLLGRLGSIQLEMCKKVLHNYNALRFGSVTTLNPSSYLGNGAIVELDEAVRAMPLTHRQMLPIVHNEATI
jgi:hypothetical protein